MSRASTARAWATAAPRLAARWRVKSGMAAPSRVTPAAMAWPPPFLARPASTQARTASRDRPPARTARAGGAAIRADGEGEGRAAEPFLEPRRHQPHDTGVPLGVPHHEDREGGILSEGPVHFRFGLGHRLGFDGLTLPIQPVEVGGDAGGLDRVAGAEQPGAEPRIADPPAGIDARSQDEAKVPRLRRFGEGGGIEQRREPRAAAMAHHREALHHEGPVEIAQGHHIRHGGERHEVEGVGKAGLGPVGAEMPVPTQGPVEGDEGEKDDSRRAQMAETGEVVPTIRVHHRVDRRQHLRGCVVIEDDHVEAVTRRLFQGPWPLVPQSTQTRTLAPSAASAAMAASFGP